MITLATLAAATPRDVFDQVRAHLLAQNARATTYNKLNDDVACCYRAGALKCAAGCLISDAEYSADMEGNTWHGLTELHVVPEAHKELIGKLQNIHDFREPYTWAATLDALECTL